MGAFSRTPKTPLRMSAADVYSDKSESRRPALLGTVAAATWLAGCGVYLTATYGSVITAGSEIAAGGAGAVGGAVAGVTLPLLLILNWTRSEGRARNLDAVIERRLSNLNKVQILPENSDEHLSLLSETFEREGAKLQRTGANMLDMFSSLENRFSNQASGLDELSKGLAGRIDDITRALDDQVARISNSESRLVELQGALNDTNDRAGETADSIVEKLERPIETASSRMEAAANHVRTHVDELWQQLQNLETAYATTRAMAEEARSALSKEAHDIQHVSSFAANEMDVLSARLAPQIDMIEEMGRRASEKTSEMQDHIDGQAHSLERVGEALKKQGAALTGAVREQAEQLASLQDKVDGFGGVISTQFQKQVDGLIEASEAAGAQVVEQAEKGTEHLQAKLKTHTDRLSEVTEDVNGTISDIVDKMDSRMSMLKQTSTDLEKTLTTASEKAADTLHQQLDSVVTTIEDRVDGIHTKAESMGEAVRIAGHDIEEHLEKSAETLKASIKKSIQDMRGDTEDLALQIKTVFDEQAETTGEEMDQRLVSLDLALGKLSTALHEQEQGFGAAVEARLTDSSKVFADKLDELRNAASDLESGVSGQADRAISKLVTKVDDFAEQVEDRLAIVQDDSESLRTTLDTTLVMLEDRTRSLNEGLTNEQSGLCDTFEASIDGMMGSFMERLKDARNMASKEVDLIREDMKLATETMQSDLSDSISTNRKSIEALQAELHTAIEASTAGAKGIQTELQTSLTANNTAVAESGLALASTLDAASENAMARLKDLVGSYEQDLTNASEDAMRRVIEMGRELPEIAANLGESAESAVEKANLAGTSLEAQRMAVISVAEDLQDYGNRIRDDFSRIPEDMRASFQSVDTLVMEATGDLKENFTGLEKHISEAGRSFDISRERLSEHLVEFNRMYEQLQKYGHNISDVVGEQIQSLTTSSDHAKKAWKDARDAMESQAEAANEISDAYIDRMEELSKRAKSDVLELTNASDAALASIETTADHVRMQLTSFASTVGGLQQLINSVGSTAEHHNALLKQSSQEAEHHTHQLVQSLSQNQQDMFLQSSTELVSQLNQIAIDVDEIMDGQVPDAVLRAYRDGDKGISVRRLLGKKQSSLGEVRIFEAYQKSASFRTKIDTYIRTFERLLGQANKSDPTKLLYTTFLTGDLGKLYVFLAESLAERKAA